MEDEGRGHDSSIVPSGLCFLVVCTENASTEYTLQTSTYDCVVMVLIAHSNIVTVVLL